LKNHFYVFTTNVQRDSPTRDNWTTATAGVLGGLIFDSLY